MSQRHGDEPGRVSPRSFALIGPQGSGKSTLFECLGGVLPSDRGTVRSGGRPVGTRERPSLLFYVPDGISPWPAQSVRWALDFTIGFLGGQRFGRVHNPPQAASLPHTGAAH